MTEVKWTAKLPLLLVGVVMFFIGLYAEQRKLFVTGLVVMLLGAAFIGYSLTIKEWCAAIAPQSAFSSAFSTSFHGCLRQKGWLEF